MRNYGTAHMNCTATATKVLNLDSGIKNHIIRILVIRASFKNPNEYWNIKGALRIRLRGLAMPWAPISDAGP